MTETIPIPQNIAEAVRHSRGPTGNMAELSAQAQRLRKALEVSQAWERAAGSSSEMLAHATYTADKLEEELSGVIWQMEVLHNLSEYRRAHRDLGTSEAGGTGELDEERTRAAHLSNTLLHIYCTLSDAPLDIFGWGRGWPRRGRAT
jgi:hypothetical protein